MALELGAFDFVNLLVGFLGATIFLGFLGAWFYQKTKIPDVILLILFGVLVGPVLGVFTGIDLSPMTPIIGTFALIVIVFEGGAKLNFLNVLKEIGESSAFTIAVTLLTVFFTVIAIFILGIVIPDLGISLIAALLLGVIVAGSSYEIIVPVLSKMKVEPAAKTLLNLEPALNSALTIVAAIAILKFMQIAQIEGLGLESFDLLGFMGDITAAFAVAIVVGAIVAFIWVQVLKRLSGKPFAYLLTMACVFVLYAVAQILGGDGITTILVFGLFLGNYGFIARAFGFEEYFKMDYNLISFQTEVSFFVRTVFFVYLGLIITISGLAGPALLVGVVLFIIIIFARYIATKVLVDTNKNLQPSWLTIFVMMPRGLTTAALASLPIMIGLTALSNSFTNIVVVVILLTNLAFAFAVFMLGMVGGKKDITIEELKTVGGKEVAVKISNDTEVSKPTKEAKTGK
ncbi:MAG: cation:proton antiporter [Candidatus Diapherotrites archaeon]